MEQPDIFAVIVAGMLPMAIGFLWYSRPLFGVQFMALIGKTEEQLRQEGPGKAFAFSFLASLVTAYILAHFVRLANVTDIAGGLQVAFWAWAGFVVTTHATVMLYERRNFGLFLLGMGYNLVSFLAMGALLAAWR